MFRSGRKKSVTPILVLACLWAIPVSATPLPLFTDDVVFEVELTGSLDDLISSRKERTEFPFVLAESGIQHSVKLRVRGKSRLKVCSFPPLRINFQRDDTEETIFSGQNKLKLVTHCRKSEGAEKNILQEYAAYKIFNLLSDISYRVRLLRITYVERDQRGSDSVLERYGFVVESDRELAARTGGRKLHIDGVPRRSLDENQAAAVFVFQYLIGNTDWSLVMSKSDDSCCHNGDLFDISARIHYVPYDFDLAGLVDAPYAYPDPVLRIRKVTQRLYRGLCLPPEAIRGALRKVIERRNDILQVLGTIPGLSSEDVDANSDYLTNFFTRAQDAEELLESFARRCL